MEATTRAAAILFLFSYFLVVPGFDGRSPTTLEFFNVLPKELRMTLLKEGPSPCQKDLLHLLENKKEPWALKMLDTFGKPSSALLEGNIRWPGSHKSCLGIVGPRATLKEGSFTGKYFWLIWVPLFKSPQNTSVNLKSGACLPETCRENDVLLNFPLINYYLMAITGSLRLNISKYVRLNGVELVPEFIPADTSTWITLCFFGTVVVTVLLVTLLDNLGNGHKTENRFLELLSCFSLVQNGSAILDRSETDPALSFLHGIRVLSFFWVVIGHSHNYISVNQRNVLEMAKASHEYRYQFVHNGIYAVDTFFFMGGFLFGYVLLKNPKFKIDMKTGFFLLLHRYLRTAPTMLVALAFNANLSPFMGQGPFWKRHLDSVAKCGKTWWSFLFYVNNFDKDNDGCSTWFWYLALDFQLFVVAVLVFAVFIKKRMSGFFLMALVVLAASLISGILVYANGYQTFLDYLWFAEKNAGDTTGLAEAFRAIYVKPYCRAVAYMAGILGAIYLPKRNISSRKGAPLRPQWGSVVICLSSLLAVISFPFYVDRGRVANAIFVPSSQILWSVGVGFLFFACLRCNTGVVHSFLSWSWWRPLSKLTFAGYLLHPVLLHWVYYSGQQLNLFSHKYLTTVTLGVLATTFTVALVFSLLFEAPFIRLAKAMLQGKGKAKK